LPERRISSSGRKRKLKKRTPRPTLFDSEDEEEGQGEGEREKSPKGGGPFPVSPKDIVDLVDDDGDVEMETENPVSRTSSRGWRWGSTGPETTLLH